MLELVNKNGVWRSWQARSLGEREAGGSSPLTPTFRLMY